MCKFLNLEYAVNCIADIGDEHCAGCNTHSGDRICDEAGGRVLYCNKHLPLCAPCSLTSLITSYIYA